MVNSNDPANIPYIITYPGGYYVAYKERNPAIPYITVSGKGVSNGLSTEYNDGADFGPDSYNPNYTGSGIPYTQTSGIQEAWDYWDNIVANDTTGYSLQPTVALKDGEVFVLNDTVHYNKSYWHNLVSFGRGGATITQTEEAWANKLPYFEVGPDNSEDLQFLNIAFGPYIGATGYLNPVLYNPNNSGAVEADYHFNHCYFARYTNAGGTLSGFTINITAIEQLMIEECFGSLCFNVGLAGIIVITRSKVSAATPNSFNLKTGGIAIIENCYIVENPPNNDSFFNFNSSPPPTPVTGRSEGPSQFILQNITLTRPLASGNTANLVYHSSPSTFSDQAIIVRNVAGVSGTGITALHNPGNVDYVKIENVIAEIPFSGNAPTSPTLSANPPVSGTAYQNTNPYDITIDLPVYASTSGTAGTVAYGKSATSTVTEMTPKFVSGSTSSSAVDIVSLRVPAGWYFEFTGSGVTFGTASVFAD